MPGKQDLGENFFPSSKWHQETKWKTRIRILERANPTSRPLGQGWALGDGWKRGFDRESCRKKGDPGLLLIIDSGGVW